MATRNGRQSDPTQTERMCREFLELMAAEPDELTFQI